MPGLRRSASTITVAVPELRQREGKVRGRAVVLAFAWQGTVTRSLWWRIGPRERRDVRKPETIPTYAI